MVNRFKEQLLTVICSMVIIGIYGGWFCFLQGRGGGGMFVFSVEENKMLSGGRGGVNCIDTRCIYAYE